MLPLRQRAEALGISEFPFLGRLKSYRVRMKDATFSLRQYGTRESKEVTIEGRVQFDLLQVMQRDYKLSSYSLNSVSRLCKETINAERRAEDARKVDEERKMMRQ